LLRIRAGTQIAADVAQINAARHGGYFVLDSALDTFICATSAAICVFKALCS
jgi:hypothetical protein